MVRRMLAVESAEAIMTNAVQHYDQVPRQHRRAGATLALAVVLTRVSFAPPSAQAQGQYHVLYSFTGGTDGGYPEAGLVRDNAGNLYGTTYEGGASDFGTVFELTANGGGETVLHSFTGGADGSSPRGDLVRDSAANLYGTTFYGGASNIGTVFKLDATGTETVLCAFPKGGAPEGYPEAGLVLDAKGDLYGTTSYPTACESNPGCGSAFKVKPTDKETDLHLFTGPPDGSYPQGDLLRDSKGNLYGTTVYGGNIGSCTVYSTQGCGTVFESTPNQNGTWTETVLYRFNGPPDGAYPIGNLVRDSAGNLYGTTSQGGAFSALCPGQPTGCGTVFEVHTDGTETVLYSFTGGADGDYPEAGLTRDNAGNLYGTTNEGGRYGFGTVFKVTSTGTETVLHSFAGSPNDGEGPFARLVRDSSGIIDGTTEVGGTSGYGTVFELKP